MRQLENAGRFIRLPDFPETLFHCGESHWLMVTLDQCFLSQRTVNRSGGFDQTLGTAGHSLWRHLKATFGLKRNQMRAWRDPIL